MAGTLTNEIVGRLGTCADCFALIGVFASSCLLFKLIRSLWYGLKAYILSAPLGLRLNPKKSGEWAVITGATDGIGKAFSFELARRGLNIVLISRTPEKLDDVAAQIVKKHGVKTKVIAVDFSEDWKPYDTIRPEISDLDIGVLVNNVGISYDHPEFYADIADEKRVKDLVVLNINSVTQMTRMVLKGMAERHRGIILNVSSASGARPTPLLSLYSAAKAFVDTFSQSLQMEYQAKGITVQSILPFFVSTKLSKIRRSSLMVPTPESYVRSTLNTVGIEDRTYGCWPHAIQAFLLDNLPTCITRKLIFTQLAATRKAALRKKQQKRE